MGSLHQHMSEENFNYSYPNGGAEPFAAPPLFMDGPGDFNDNPPAASSLGDPGFDILDWHPAYQSCQRYFLDYAQHEPATQALCALINIRLPLQYLNNPIVSSTPSSSTPAPGSNPTYQFNFPRPGGATLQSPNPSGAGSNQPPPVFISLIPYIKRLVVTGFDKAPILHGLFGDDYLRGVMPHVDCERRNYLFAAKHGGWGSCKSQYDTGNGMNGDESVPFMKPLDEATMEELQAAEKAWGGWLAMEDWMVGPRTPAGNVQRREVPFGEGLSAGTPSGEIGARETRSGQTRSGGDGIPTSGNDNLPDGFHEAL